MNINVQSAWSHFLRPPSAYVGIATLAWLALSLSFRSAAAAEQPAPPERVDYIRQVRPILVAHCYRCHSQLEQEGALRLDRVESILQGGDRGPVISPGVASKSLLIEAVVGSDEISMPPEGERLSEREIEILRRWIDQGAVAPSGGEIQHWAFTPPERPPIPADRSPLWTHNSIDAFISAQHNRQGLQPAPPASRRVLLRRVYLDLIGLPPTPDQLHAFLADDRPDAYERVVDRLLASSQYGHRWGRHWMDVWRYSDWSGYQMEVRNSQPHIWRWRDWIIESLNEDKPYNRMIVEMLAGDEAAPGDAETLRATGYLVRNWYKFNRNVWLQNTVDHTAQAFLGLTVGCARCHDHMYDPVTQQDYYRFRAFFEPHKVRTDEGFGLLDPSAGGLPRVYDAEPQAETFVFTRGDERYPDKDQSVTPALPGYFGGELDIQPVSLPPQTYYPALNPLAQQQKLQQARDALKKADGDLADKKTGLAEAERNFAQSEIASREEPTEMPRNDSPPTTSKAVIDDFSMPRPALWIVGSGDWRYEGGRLVQLRTGSQKCELVMKTPPPVDFPVDFSARLRFKTTGGERWKSVGISFDRIGEQECRGVYLSAVAGGSKVQISRTQEGKTTYPQAGAKGYPAKLGQQYELHVQVRGELVNVAVNGETQIAYRLAGARQQGAISIWAFDAQAEFLEFRLAPLDESVALLEPSGAVPVQAPATPEAALQKAQSELELAQLAQAAARDELTSISARVAADKAKYAEPPPSDAHELAKSASQAERTAAVSRAAAELRRAELEQGDARAALRSKPGDAKLKKAAADAEKKIASTTKSLAEARKALDAEKSEYSPLGDVYPAASTGRRLALANWIATDRNPLTARVAVNHIWMRHFGAPLVERVFDFGTSSPPPPHAELLDWLALDLMHSGWSMKTLHRRIVTSNTYRMSSSTRGVGERNRQVDPDNYFLWRMNSRRMEAEIVRDSVLYVAGSLDYSMGGPELDYALGQTSRRRSVYYRHAYEKQMTFLKLFDAASVEECYRRDHSVIPQQALALSNSPLALAHARRLAAALSGYDGEPSAAEVSHVGDARFVAAAFECVLGRLPSDQEQRECESFLASQSRLLSNRRLLHAFNSGPEKAVKAAADPAQRARENLVHVLLNHNDFVTIR